jgi:hypothetical protein
MTERQITTQDLAEQSPGNGSTEAGDEPRATQPADPDALAESNGANELAGASSAIRDGEDEASKSPSLESGPLLPADEGDRFTTRWQEIQVTFVDEPRESVEQADALVADLMQRLAASFSNERERLEGQWDRGDDVSTEDLRVSLTRYRSFFDRLLSA